MSKFVGMSNELGRYIFMTIDEGEEEIRRLSSKLYTGVLEKIKPGWLNDNTYMPHMTVGEFNNDDDLMNALKSIRGNKYKFTTIVEKVSVEIIDENEDSIIEMQVNLK